MSERYRVQQAELSRKASSERREIGAIPDIVSVRRRARCRKSLKLFCETYNPDNFSMPWCADHDRAIARIEEAANQGALYAFAMPRGTGKTTICRMAALWALSYALCRYVFIIGANAEKAERTLQALKIFARFLPTYAADFPEISYPAQSLGGIANRSTGQTCGDRSTLIEWSKDRLILPTVPPPANWPKSWDLRSDGMVPSSGGAASASGLTGEGIRGSLLTLSTGEEIRPDLVLLDDPQTPESARSPTQNDDRLQLVSADVLGMAGPGKTIAAVMPCTVIEPGDMVDTILDRQKHPMWRGERTRMLKTMPKNMEAWGRYFDIYGTCAQLEPPDFADSNAHYIEHQAELEEGAEASWQARKLPDEVSPIQHAMHLYFRDKRSFMAEYQNDPMKGDLGVGSKELIPAEIAKRFNGVDRFAVPRECPTLTAGFDVGGGLHWYVVIAWTESFGGSVIDYGCWPRQSRESFAAIEPRPSLRDRYDPKGEKKYTASHIVYQGLLDLTAEVLGRVYPNEQTGGEMKISRALVDCGYESDAVYQFARSSPYVGLLTPSKGIPRTASARGVNAWAARPGERKGHHWRLTKAETGRGQMVQFDPDAWKSVLYERFTTPMGGKTGLSLYGKAPGQHEMISRHLAAEYASPVMYHGATFDKFIVHPDRPDNHLLDCCVLAAVAASVSGLVLSATADGRPPTVETKKPQSFAAKVKARRAEKMSRQLTGAR